MIVLLFFQYLLPVQDDISGNQIRTLGLKDLVEWNIYELKSCPGILKVMYKNKPNQLQRSADYHMIYRFDICRESIYESRPAILDS